MTDVLNCPFCGHSVDLNNPDTLYPNGTGWRIGDDDIISYCTAKEVPREQWCYSMHCVATSGGCGAEISANSKEETLKKWNKRVDIS